MSATKSPTARRRSAVEYGARSAVRTSTGIGGRDNAAAARTNVAVTYADQLPQRTAACQPDQRRRGSRRRHGDPGVGQDQPGDLIKVA